MKNKKIELLKKKLSMLALATSLSVTSLSGCSNSELSNEEETKIENETFLVNDEISQEELETISYETNEEENKDEIDYEEDFKFSIHLNQASNVCTIDISLCCTEQDIKKIQMFLRDNQENIYSVSLNSSSVYDNKTIIKEILKTISNNKNVTQLDLQDLDMDVADIASMSQLKKLCLISGTIDNIDLINQFTQLESLYLYLDDENTDNLNIISNLSQLKELVVTNLEDDQHINNIEILRKFTNLERLDLFNNNISDISPIAELKKLQYLNISYNNIENISPLCNLENLKIIWLNENPITDISILKDMKSTPQISLDELQLNQLNPYLNELTEKGFHFFDTAQGKYITKENLKQVEALQLKLNK